MPNRPDAIAALNASRERAAKLGVVIQNFQLSGAGPATGGLIRSVSADSLAGLEEARRNSMQTSEPDPLAQALSAGILTELSQAISVLYEVQIWTSGRATATHFVSRRPGPLP